MITYLGTVKGLKEAVHKGKEKKPYRNDFGILIPEYRIDAVDYESAKIFGRNRIFRGHPSILSGDDGKSDFFEKS